MLLDVLILTIIGVLNVKTVVSTLGTDGFRPMGYVGNPKMMPNLPIGINEANFHPMVPMNVRPNRDINSKLFNSGRSPEAMSNLIAGLFAQGKVGNMQFHPKGNKCTKCDKNEDKGTDKKNETDTNHENNDDDFDCICFCFKLDKGFQFPFMPSYPTYPTYPPYYNYNPYHPYYRNDDYDYVDPRCRHPYYQPYQPYMQNPYLYNDFNVQNTQGIQDVPNTPVGETAPIGVDNGSSSFARGLINIGSGNMINRRQDFRRRINF